MKNIGIVLCTYNRPLYLQDCLDSLKLSDLTRVDTILIIDDFSTDRETIKLISEFNIQGIEVVKYFKLQNKSIKDSLLYGFDYFFNKGYDLVTNLDSDALVANNWVDKLLEVKEKYPSLIVTGFNCNTLNKNGSIRHEHLYKEDGVTFRKSVGGINMMINKEQYHKYVKPALTQTLAHFGNWDDHSCRNSMADSLPIAVVTPSIIQHIGINSSMNHGAGGEPADVADDFKLLSLPNVTLIGVDGVDVNRLIKAADISCKEIEFGAVKILSHISSNDKRVIPIRPIKDIKDYSQFILKELVNYVDTDYALLIQHDGFVLRALSWQKEFLDYDMIGASWKWRPEKRTANGGLSIRSKKMMEAIRDDENIYLQNDNLIKNYAEDHVLFYIYREYLEEKYGVKIAPENLCDKFSIEAWGMQPPFNKYRGSFGFHGFSVDFKDAQLPYIPYLLPNPNRHIL